MIELNFGKDNIIQIPKKGALPQFGHFVKAKYKYPSAGSTLHWTDYYNPSDNYGFSFKEYIELSEIKPYKHDFKGYPAVSVSRRQSPEYINLHMLWISERSEVGNRSIADSCRIGEWITIVHRKREVSASTYKESYFGPFALDEMCSGKILEAYQIRKRFFIPSFRPF